MPANAEFFSATYAVLRDSEGKVLCMRRAGTPFFSGYFQLPAGHLEGTETVYECMARELHEELGITVALEDLQVIHISHRVSTDRVYFDVYLEVKKYQGTPSIQESHKCSELRYVDLEQMPDDLFVGYDIEIIQRSMKGEFFSEMVIGGKKEK